MSYLGFNQGLSELPGSDVKGANPFRDRRVREAVYRAIDMGELIARAEAGLAVPAGMLAVPGVNGYDPELDRRLPHDLEGRDVCSPRPATRADLRYPCSASRPRSRPAA